MSSNVVPTRVAVIGNGVVGQRVVKRLGRQAHCEIVQIDTRVTPIRTSARVDGVDVAILAHPGPHHPDVIDLLDRGTAVVSVGDQVEDVIAMCGEEERAVANGVSLVVAAGMSPGLGGLIARFLASQLDVVDEIHVAIHGTAGPACARQHHRALAGHAPVYDDGQATTVRAGTGRELAWFPEPVGAYDCYFAEVPSPVVLHQSFPDVTRISARMSANRRDRFTSRLPMLTPPHHEGGVGALRVEVRGANASGGRVTLIAGIAEMVGTATAATASAYAQAVTNGMLPIGLTLPGDASIDTLALLHSIERFGVRLQEFTGVPSA